MASIGTFFGLNIGMNALDTMQQAESVVSNNIANASNPGYVQENTVISESGSFPSQPAQNAPIVAGQLGEGTMVTDVQRAVSPFLNQLVRNNLSQYQGQSTLHASLSELQGIFGEPSSYGIQSALDAFAAAWQTLSTDPQSTAARTTVIQQASNLSNSTNMIQNQLQSWINNNNSVIQGQVKIVNQYAQQIQSLNTQISQIEALSGSTGDGPSSSLTTSPNQLLDQRGQILNELAKMGNISYTQDSNGTVSVSFGGQAIVTGNSATLQPLDDTAQSPSAALTSVASAVSSGSLTTGSMWANQTASIAANQLLGQLTSLQSAIATAVNAQQGQGYPLNSSQQNSNTPTIGGIANPNYNPIFVTAANSTTPDIPLNVNSQLTPQQLGAASSANAPADGTNAVAMSQLFTSSTSSLASALGQATPDTYFAGMMAALGGQTSAASNQEQVANSLLQQSQTQQQAVSGVNINEEASKMVQFQSIYDAAAKFISVTNQMVATLIQEV